MCSDMAVMRLHTQTHMAMIFRISFDVSFWTNVERVLYVENGWRNVAQKSDARPMLNCVSI